MLKIGVFGVGHLGKFHLNNWKEIKEVEVVGFYDPSDDAAQDVTEKYQIPRFLDVERLIDAVDVLDVLAPTPQHFYLAQQAIRKGPEPHVH